MSFTDEEPTIGRLVADISRDVSLLIQNEIALAKSELKVSVRASGWGILFFAIAGFLGLLIVILASITFAYLLTLTGLHPAWAFGIVTLVYLAIAIVLCILGYFRFKKVRMPERTIDSARRLPEVFKLSSGVNQGTSVNHGSGVNHGPSAKQSPNFKQGPSVDEAISSATLSRPPRR